MGATLITVYVDGEPTQMPRAEALKAISEGRATADAPPPAPAKKAAKKPAKAKKETAAAPADDVETATES